MLFRPILGHFLCSAVILVIFSSNLGDKKIQRNKYKNPKKKKLQDRQIDRRTEILVSYIAYHKAFLFNFSN